MLFNNVLSDKTLQPKKQYQWIHSKTNWVKTADKNVRKFEDDDFEENGIKIRPSFTELGYRKPTCPERLPPKRPGTISIKYIDQQTNQLLIIKERSKPKCPERLPKRPGIFCNTVDQQPNQLPTIKLNENPKPVIKQKENTNLKSNPKFNLKKIQKLSKDPNEQLFQVIKTFS